MSEQLMNVVMDVFGDEDPRPSIMEVVRRIKKAAKKTIAPPPRSPGDPPPGSIPGNSNYEPRISNFGPPAPPGHKRKKSELELLDELERDIDRKLPPKKPKKETEQGKFDNLLYSPMAAPGGDACSCGVCNRAWRWCSSSQRVRRCHARRSRARTALAMKPATHRR